MTQLKQFSEGKGINSSRFKLYTSDQRQIPNDVNSQRVFEQAPWATLHGRRIVKAKRQGATALAPQPKNVTPAELEFDQRRVCVLVHVQAEIKRQVLAVDDAMRQAEREFDTDAEWREKQAQRDAELEALDRGLAAWQETGAQSADSESIGKTMDALTRLPTLHHEM